VNIPVQFFIDSEYLRTRPLFLSIQSRHGSRISIVWNRRRSLFSVTSLTQLYDVEHIICEH